VQRKFKRIVVFVGAASLAGGAVSGGATPQDQTRAVRPAEVRMAPGGIDVSAAAEDLGVSERRLRAVVEALRSREQPSSRSDSTETASQLADALGVPSEKVDAALKAARRSGVTHAGQAAPNAA
jgi:plasmid maintenance system antidote protein VapI